MIEIFNRNGLVVAWFDGNAVLDRASQSWICFVADDLAFSAHGKVLGYFREGFFLDKAGSSVAFVMGARRGPALPAQLVGASPRAVPPRPAPPPRPSFPSCRASNSRWGEEWESFVQPAR